MTCFQTFFISEKNTKTVLGTAEEDYHSLSGLLYKYGLYVLHPSLLDFARLPPGIRVATFENRWRMTTTTG